MRTTVRLDAALLRRLKERAAREGRSMTAIIEEAVRAGLAPAAPARGRPVRLPVSRAGGGLRPGVDLDDGAGLLDRLDDGHVPR